MWAHVTDDVVDEVLERPRAFTDDGGVQHPASVLLRGTDAELRVLRWYRVQNAPAPPLGPDQVFGPDVFTFDPVAQTVTRTKTVRDLTAEEVAARDAAAAEAARQAANAAFLQDAKTAFEALEARVAALEAAQPGPP